jgi:hypothetical protein
MNGVSNFFDDLWNKAEGVFDKVIDFKLQDLEIDRARDQAMWEFQLRQDQLNGYQPSLYETAGPGGGYGSAGNGKTMLLVGGGLVLAFVAYTALKR